MLSIVMDLRKQLFPPYMGAAEGVEVQILGIQVYNNVILPSGLIFVDE